MRGRRAEIRARRGNRRRARRPRRRRGGVFLFRVRPSPARVRRLGRRRHEVRVQAFGSEDRPVHDFPALLHAQPRERGASRAVHLRPTGDAPVAQRGVRRGPAGPRLGRALVGFGRRPRRGRRGRRRAQRRRGHGARLSGPSRRGRQPRGSVRPPPRPRSRATMPAKDESTPPPSGRFDRATKRARRHPALNERRAASSFLRSTPFPRTEVTLPRTRDAFNARASLCFDRRTCRKRHLFSGTQQS